MHALERLMASVLSALGLDPAWLIYAAPVSVLVMVLTAVLTPWLVARIPEDYFVRAHPRGPSRHWMIRAAMTVVKNLLGALLVGAGTAMLVFPGPGILTLLGGLALLDLPGKRRIECWMVSRPGVRDLIALLRARAGRPPLRLPPRYG